MNRKTLILIISCLLFGVLSIGLLGLISNRLEADKNGFVRVFSTYNLNNDKILDIKYDSYYIAGGTQDRIYLGNYTSPSHLLITNYALTDTQHVSLLIPKKDTFVESVATVNVNSPHIYMKEGITPSILRGTLSDLNMVNYLQESPTFSSSKGVPISASSFVLRTYNEALQQNILSKVSLGPPGIIHANDALKKQYDGIFCTDGTLHYDPVIARLTYIYFYRNQFVNLDTSMNVMYYAKTIDTVSQAKLKVDEIKSKNESTLTSTLLVNGMSCVFNNLLFVNSALCADNEDPKIFSRNSVIDVYDLTDGHYQFSFYLPGINRRNIGSLQIFDQILVVINDHYLITYNLEKLLTSQLQT